MEKLVLMKRFRLWCRMNCLHFQNVLTWVEMRSVMGMQIAGLKGMPDVLRDVIRREASQIRCRRSDVGMIRTKTETRILLLVTVSRWPAQILLWMKMRQMEMLRFVKYRYPWIIAQRMTRP